MSTEERRARARRRPMRRRVPDEGRMPLADHLRELRNRLFKAGLGILAGAVVGWVFYDQIFDVLRQPFDDYVASVSDDQTVVLTLSGITSAFSLKLNVAMFTGLVLSTPIWTYQLWAFISPGLHQRERRWTLAFVAAATPLFLAGVGLAYLILPTAVEILLDLTPNDVANLPTVSEYLSFVLRLALAFGIAFLLPVLVVGLNFAGVLTAHRLRTWWRGSVVGVFVFAAVATPTPDPWNMTLLAIPMLLLLLIAWAIAWWHDRRRPAHLSTDTCDDDEASSVDAPEPIEPVEPMDTDEHRGP
jgi:sec-independent protein translocase protein TatC